MEFPTAVVSNEFLFPLRCIRGHRLAFLCWRLPRVPLVTRTWFFQSTKRNSAVLRLPLAELTFGYQAFRPLFFRLPSAIPPTAWPCDVEQSMETSRAFRRLFLLD